MRPWPIVVLAGTLGACAADPGDPSDEANATGPADAGSSSEGTDVSTASNGDTAEDSSGEPAEPSEWSCPGADAPPPRFVLGWDYKDGWLDLEPNGPVTIIVGGQGSWMIPIGVRGEGFCVPSDPHDYERVPTLDIRIEAEGFAEAIAEVQGFPVSFEPAKELGLGYTFIPMILPDGIPVVEFEGAAVSIRSELRVRDGPPLGFTLDGVLTVSE